MTDVVEDRPLAGLERGAVIELVHSESDARDAVAALAEVWVGPDGQPPMPAELAWVFAHSGNYVAVARAGGRGGEVIGSAIGFRGVDEDGPLLHSHIAGVVPGWQGAAVGFALKQHQRNWALAAGLARITWTFDPLVARNAYFNVMKLGARVRHYFVDFYGPMQDSVNDDDETDRCLATWVLDSPRVTAAAAGANRHVDVAAVRRDGAADVLTPDADGHPVVRPSNADVRLLQLPRDAVALRRTEPASAHAWRYALREVLVPAFADGLEVVAVTRDADYVLARPTD